jgi:hypothetical protein
MSPSAEYLSSMEEVYVQRSSRVFFQLSPNRKPKRAGGERTLWNTYRQAWMTMATRKTAVFKHVSDMVTGLLAQKRSDLLGQRLQAHLKESLDVVDRALREYRYASSSMLN